jgi:hypothetical protein
MFNPDDLPGAGAETPSKTSAGRARSNTGGSRRSPKPQRKSTASADDLDGSGQTLANFPESVSTGWIRAWAAKRDITATVSTSRVGELGVEITSLKQKIVALEEESKLVQARAVKVGTKEGALTAEKAAFDASKQELISRAQKVTEACDAKIAEVEARHKEAIATLEVKNAGLQKEVTELTGDAAGEKGGLAAQLEHKTEEVRKSEYALAESKAENADLVETHQRELEAARADADAQAVARMAELEAQLEAFQAKDAVSSDIVAENAALQAKLEVMDLALQKAEDSKDAAEAKANAAGGVNADAIVAAMAKYGGGAGFALPGSKAVTPSIKITDQAGEFDPNTTIQVKRLASKMKLTMGAAGEGFKSLEASAVSGDLEPGKFKAGKFTIKVNNGTQAQMELVEGDTLEKVIEKIGRGIGDNDLPLTVESKALNGKQFIVIKAKEIGAEYRFEIYSEEEGVLQNIDRQVLPGPNKVCIYANALSVDEESGAINPKGFSSTMKWHEHFDGRVDFAKPQTLKVNGKDILRNISPEGNANPAYRVKTEDALSLIGALIKKEVGDGCKSEIKPTRGNEVCLEITSNGPIDIDFPENSMLSGSMVGFGAPDDVAIVSINGVGLKGFTFHHDGIGEFMAAGVDSAPWIVREHLDHIELVGAL